MFLATIAVAQDVLPLRLSRPVHSAQVTDLGDGAYEVRTTGPDPYVLAAPLDADYDPTRLVMFSFEYTCPAGLDYFEVFFVAPKSGWRNVTRGPIAPATGWQPFAVNLQAVEPVEWDGSVRQFRIDFGSGEGKTVNVRNIQLRAMTAEEARAEAERLAEEQRQLAELQARVEQTLIATARIEDLGNTIAASHEFALGGNVTRVSVLGRELDLATQLRDYAAAHPPPVKLPPAMVVGEGPGPENHTVVRILNRYGICEVQFLAYPPSVRGGVQVVTGDLLGDGPCIAAAPLLDASLREVRLFDRNGNRIGEIDVPLPLAPPFAIAAGDFLREQPAEELAVGSASDASLQVAFYSGAGELLRTIQADLPARRFLPSEGPNGGRSGPHPARPSLTLSTGRAEEGPDVLIAYVAGHDRFFPVNAESGAADRLLANFGPDCTGIYQSAFGQPPLVGTLAEPLFSSLLRLTPDGAAERLNVGERENRFWFTAVGPYEDVPETQYTRHSLFAHIRTDFMSPVAGDPDFGRTDAEYWAGPEFRQHMDARLATYDTDPPVCWEPCLTHRWFHDPAQKWAAVSDAETGLPMYTLVDRENHTGTYGEFGQTNAFVSGTYAPGLPTIDAMYTHPLRAFLRGLVERFRGNPEHFVAVEPNHEMEINAESETTHGDYNPYMIRAFYRYLVSLCGDLETINRVFGTPFTPQRFDAPRDLQRGPWDAYSTDNPYYMAWMRFMNYIIYRVVAGTYREALLAGFPPEAIKCHQIPDHYAIASLTAFSKPARRVTPIDWNLNAGVGFGFTRYGVWFNQEHNCVQGPYSSGFDAMVVGEYQSLTPDADLAYQQLAYMRDHGVQFIHCMVWPEGHDRGYNAALAEALDRLAAEDKPRPGLTGGTGQVRAVPDPVRPYDIVSLGTGEDHTGLLKSVNADGSWEGSVYVVPFHSHIDIEPLAERRRVRLADRPLTFGPLAPIDAGNLIELSFYTAAREPQSTVSVRLYHHGIELPAQRVAIPITAERRHYRCLVRVQIDMDDLTVELGSGDVEHGTWLAQQVTLRDFVAVRHTERSTKLKRGILAGERHQGGVTFDLFRE